MTQLLNDDAELRTLAQRDQDPLMDVGIAPSAWRMPAAMRLGHVVLQVSDLARSLYYYTHVLGLRVKEKRESFAMLTTEDGLTPLVELHEKAGAHPAHGKLGLYHFAILLPDRPALGRFIAHLAEIGARAGASDHFVSEALYLRDPDGLGIEVYADRPRTQWRAHNRQLQMATEPLDLGDVMRSANGAPWTEMPAGTVMGHLHLHVGDIDTAAAFYHETLGLDKMVWTYQGALFLAAGGYHHHLGLNIWAGPHARPAGSDDAKLLEWRIVLPSQSNVDEVSSLLATAGYTVTHDGSDRITADPWGTHVRLSAS